MQKKPDIKPDEGFLSRWSRHKKQVIDGTDDPQSGKIQPQQSLEKQRKADPDPGQDAIIDSDSAEKNNENKLLSDEDMPDIDSLTESSDYSAFMSPGVSEGLRKLALRKLFSSAGFNVRDGLDDYDDDFRNFAALGDIITSDMKHQMELAEQRKQQQETEIDEQRDVQENELIAEDQAEDDSPDEQSDEPVSQKVKPETNSEDA